MLALFDAAVHELFHLAAVNTHDVIVMRALIELEHRHAAFKMMARDQAGGLELRQHPIDGGETDVFIGHQELFVDVFSAHMPRGPIREDVQDFEAWQRYFETCVAQIIAFAGRVGLQALRHAGPLGYDGSRLSII